jgi:coenzyme PQQ precursor peptide PqqA
MAWTTPTLVEICIGLEINGYLPPSSDPEAFAGCARRGGERVTLVQSGSRRRSRRFPSPPREPGARLSERTVGDTSKTRHQKRPAETGGRNGASIAKVRTRRPAQICETARYREVSTGRPALMMI